MRKNKGHDLEGLRSGVDYNAAIDNKKFKSLADILSKKESGIIRCCLKLRMKNDRRPWVNIESEPKVITASLESVKQAALGLFDKYENIVEILIIPEDTNSLLLCRSQK